MAYAGQMGRMLTPGGGATAAPNQMGGGPVPGGSPSSWALGATPGGTMQPPMNGTGYSSGTMPSGTMPPPQVGGAGGAMQRPSGVMPSIGGAGGAMQTPSGIMPPPQVGGPGGAMQMGGMQGPGSGTGYRPGNPQQVWASALGGAAPGMSTSAFNPWSPGLRGGGQYSTGGSPGMMQGMFAQAPSVLQRWTNPGQGASI
jgi:hypothetical protein